MIEVRDFREFLLMDNDELLIHFADTPQQLASLQQEIGICEADQVRGRSLAYQRSEQTSVNGRNQEAEVATSTVTSTLLELYADKATLLEQKFLLARLLDA